MQSNFCYQVVLSLRHAQKHGTGHRLNLYTFFSDATATVHVSLLHPLCYLNKLCRSSAVLIRFNGLMASLLICKLFYYDQVFCEVLLLPETILVEHKALQETSIFHICMIKREHTIPPLLDVFRAGENHKLQRKL